MDSTADKLSHDMRIMLDPNELECCQEENKQLRRELDASDVKIDELEQGLAYTERELRCTKAELRGLKMRLAGIEQHRLAV